MLEGRRIHKKALLAGAGGLLIFGLVIVWLISYLTNGTVIVTTDSRLNAITLVSADRFQHPDSHYFSKKANGTLSAKLKSGDYIASVEGGSLATAQLIHAKAHTTLRYTINPVKATGVEPVALPLNAQNIVANAAGVTYLDQSNNSISRLGADNQTAELFVEESFESVQWADANYGVGKSLSGDLYVIKDSGLTALTLPGPSENRPVVQYAVTKNRAVYLLIGSIVYKSNGDSNFSVVYSDAPAGSTLVAGTRSVAILVSGDSDNSEGEENPSITTIDNSGKVTSKSVGTFYAAWSQNDTYLAVSSTSGGEVLDSKLRQVAAIPQGAFTNPHWLDDKTLFYNVRDQLWSYDVLSQKSQLVANMPLGDAISEFVVSDDKASIYMTTVDDNDQVALRRVGLRGQAVPDFVYRLQDVLPKGLPDVVLNFTNLTRPTVLVRPYSEATADQDALNQATTELQQDGFDTSKIQIQLAPFPDVP